MRAKKAFRNIISSLFLQLVTVLCGFVVPKVIISNFGSETNGLITSITQFLGYISLVEAGVGGVVRAALYGPLAKKDTKQINKIIKAASVFFKRVAYFSILYIVILAVIYPLIALGQFDYWFTFSLVVIIGISSFAQYYFGITYQLLLQADQKQYVGSLLQVATLIINMLLVIVMVKLNFGIVAVKIISSLAFIIRPIAINLLVKKRYSIDLRCEYDKKVLAKKRDGFAHHIAYFLHTNTDIVVLTIFSSMKDVSVYSIYCMIVTGVRRLVTTFSSGLEATFGNMLANDEKENLKSKFNTVETFAFLISNTFFVTALVSIEPFMSIYTSGFVDADYQKPVLGVFLIIAEYMYCIRSPFNSLIIGAGHFKETKKSAYLEAGINILLSIIFVNVWGINGVAFATFIAMTYRTLFYVYYLKRNLIQRSVWIFIGKMLLTLAAGFLSIIVCDLIGILSETSGYFDWGLRTFGAFAIIGIINTIFWRLFYAKDFLAMKKIIKSIARRIRKKKKVKV